MGIRNKNSKPGPKSNTKPNGKGNGKGNFRGKGRGKWKDVDLDFLNEEDDGHFGLRKHAISGEELMRRKWIKTDMGNLLPNGFNAADFGEVTGIEQLDPSDYPGLTVLKRKKPDGPKDASEKAPKKQKKEKPKNKKVAQNQTSGDESVQETQPSGSKKAAKNNNKAKGAVETSTSTSEKPAQQKKQKQNHHKPTAESIEAANKQLEAMKDALLTGEGESMDAWNEYKLHHKLLDGLQFLHFSAPTDIQKSALPIALSNKDIVAAAETGSGKTLAFGLPIIHNILHIKEKNPVEKEGRQGPLAIIISPTRELASQIVDHLKAVARFTTIQEISVVPIIGGMSLPKQVRLLSYKPDIVVATPGRLWDLYESGNEYVNHLESAKYIVLDEADRLIQGNHFKEMDMLFEKLQMKKVQGVPIAKKTRQIFLFSATLINQNIQIQHNRNAPTSAIEQLFSKIVFQNPVETIDITKKQLTATNLREAKILCEDTEKDFQLYYLLQRYKGKTIVFVNSIHGVKRLASLLRVLQIIAYPLYSDMEQRMRLKNLDRFRKAERAVLVATDVAARGLDIPNIDHVIHFQIPLNAETYVHRSGRTARANKDGIAVMLISPEDQKNFVKIFKVLNKTVSDVVDFPVDPYFMPAIKKRVDMAHEIELSAHRNKKASLDKQWLAKNADFVGENIREYYPSSDDEDDKTITARRQKKIAAANIVELQKELDVLLKKPLLPVGINRKYVTSTHFSSALLVDPSSFHSSGAIHDLEHKGEEKRREEEEREKQKEKARERARERERMQKEKEEKEEEEGEGEEVGEGEEESDDEDIMPTRKPREGRKPRGPPRGKPFWLKNKKNKK